MARVAASSAPGARAHGPIRAHGRTVCVEESQRTIVRLADADARAHADRGGRRAFAQLNGALRIQRIAPARTDVDPERATETAGAATVEWLEAAPWQRLGRPDQHAACGAFFLHRDVQAVVHAVDEVDVQRARRAPD